MPNTACLIHMERKKGAKSYPVKNFKEEPSYNIIGLVLLTSVV